MDGNKAYEGNYVNGSREGLGIEYDNEGNIIYEGNFVNDYREDEHQKELTDTDRSTDDISSLIKQLDEM